MSESSEAPKKPTVQEICECMQRHNENRAAVCRELQLTNHQLNSFIRRYDVLKQFHNRKPIPPAVLETITRTPPGDPQMLNKPEDPNTLLQSAEDLKLADIIEKEDRKLKDALIRFGGTESEADLVLSFTAFRNRHVESTLGMTVTGVALNFRRMMDVMRELEARIKKAAMPVEQGGVPFRLNEHGEPTEEEMVYESYRGIAEECRKTAEFIWRGQVAKAKVEAMIRLGRNTTRRTATTPGFAPKSAKVSQ